jgi:hypothetical protein
MTDASFTIPLPMTCAQHSPRAVTSIGAHSLAIFDARIEGAWWVQQKAHSVLTGIATPPRAAFRAGRKS